MFRNRLSFLAIAILVVLVGAVGLLEGRGAEE